MVCIFIVDDFFIECYKLWEILEKYGYYVLEVVNGVDGVVMVCLELLDLVLMDVVMLGLNGFQVICQFIKGVDIVYILIIIVIIKDQEIDWVWGKCQGVKDYLIKLVYEDVLLKIVDW